MISSKARKRLVLLYRKFYNFTSNNALLRLYLSLVRPHLEYAAAIWSPLLKEDQIMLERVQKFGLRMATRDWNDSYYNLHSFQVFKSVE